jgi:hypothetical protein
MRSLASDDFGPVTSVLVAAIVVAGCKTAEPTDVSGAWTCPGRGMLTIMRQDQAVTGVAIGEDAEHWGTGGRWGARLEGRSNAAGQLVMTWRHGDQTTTTTTSRVSADGRLMSGEWTWFRGPARLDGGTWQCARVAGNQAEHHGARHLPVQPVELPTCERWDARLDEGNVTYRGQWVREDAPSVCHVATWWTESRLVRRRICPLNDRAEFWSDAENGIRYYYRNDIGTDFARTGQRLAVGGRWDGVASDGRQVSGGNWRAICAEPGRR